VGSEELKLVDAAKLLEVSYRQAKPYGGTPTNGQPPVEAELPEDEGMPDTGRGKRSDRQAVACASP
jgi:hypothetical protein